MDFNKIENLACYIKMSQNFINSYHSQPTKKIQKIGYMKRTVQYKFIWNPLHVI